LIGLKRKSAVYADIKRMAHIVLLFGADVDSIIPPYRLSCRKSAN